ncbi:unnamed protein product [Owenia fusiformis]|uniref:Uncharacterized protein n=1 Tax=Owenia fusiformis TaxID=6347 RepID=A0A8S4NFK1_OWEFU|nr:unnamed protein product [Owenia fusiformis]
MVDTKERMTDKDITAARNILGCILSKSDKQNMVSGSNSIPPHHINIGSTVIRAIHQGIKANIGVVLQVKMRLYCFGEQTNIILKTRKPYLVLTS